MRYWVLLILAVACMIAGVAVCFSTRSVSGVGQQVAAPYLRSSITPSDARALVAREKDVLDLRSLQGINLDVAREIAGFRGIVNLSGLRSVPSAAVHELAKMPVASSLQLNGLSQLEQEVAAELGGFPGLYLSLNGLRRLAPEVAAKLAEYGSKATVGSTLHLNGIEELPEPVADRLGSCRALGLNLNGVVGLDVASAQKLARFKGRVLSMSGIKRASDEVISALSRFSGDMLDLSGLEELSPGAAASLSRFGGDALYLSSLADASEEVLSHLARFDGHLELPSPTHETVEPENGPEKDRHNP